MEFLRNIPALPPPDGTYSNFEHPQTLASSLIIVNAIFLSLMLGGVALRLYTRAILARALGWDDCRLIRTHGIDPLLTKMMEFAVLVRR